MNKNITLFDTLFPEIAKLKEQYYENTYSLETLKTRYKALSIKPEKYTSFPTEGALSTLMYDDDGDAFMLLYFYENSHPEEYEEALKSLYSEYNKYFHFYDEVTALLPEDILVLALRKMNLPVCAIIDLSKDVNHIMTMSREYEYTKGQFYYREDWR